MFKGNNPSLMATLMQINVLSKDYISWARANSLDRESQPMDRFYNNRWRAPPRGWIKINTDAAFKQSSNIGVSGIVVRDQNGTLLTGLAKKHAAGSSFMAETLAMRDGIFLANSLGLHRVILESDSLEVVQACRKEIQRGEVSAILEDIWQTKQNFLDCGFT